MSSRRGSLGRLLILAAVLVVVQGCRDEGLGKGDAALCLSDLRAAFGLVERNYAGYPEKSSRIGAGAIEAARASSLAQCNELDHAGAERAVLKQWLASFGDGHLGVSSAEPATPRPSAELPVGAPELEVLGDEATWIRAPSFMPDQRQAVEELVSRHRDEIVARPLLVIDVRGNDGGVDASYRPLKEFLYAEPVKTFGVEVLATPENIAAWERASQALDATLRPKLEEKIALMRAHVGEWVTLAADSTETLDSVLPLPARVAVVIDDRCASSCEQFVLLARASSKVRLFGKATAGILDYANVVEHPLPSGLTLHVPTTRSRRLPAAPVDGIGIPPDVEMDTTSFDGSTRADALRRVIDDLRPE